MKLIIEINMDGAAFKPEQRDGDRGEEARRIINTAIDAYWIRDNLNETLLDSAGEICGFIRTEA